jgi:hypothetical protein
MRNSAGYFTPARNVVGFSMSPCTSVPSLLFDVNSSTAPSVTFDSHSSF